MPVRSLSSPVFKWPDRNKVHSALSKWTEVLVASRPDIIKVGYIGSYARGDWGVGSDVDLVVVIEGHDMPFLDRTMDVDLGAIPVPVDTLLYTWDEWEGLLNQTSKFTTMIKSEAVWLYSRD